MGQTKMELDREIAAMVPAFLQRREQDVQLIRSLLQQKDFDGVAAIGHKLKGNGSAFGFPQLSEAGLQLELAAKTHDFETTRQSLQEFENLLRSIQNESTA